MNHTSAGAPTPDTWCRIMADAYKLFDDLETGDGARLMIGPMATALNALSNASRDAVFAQDVTAILATGDGPGHLVRALFGDCAFETLDRLAAEAGLSRAALRASYANARRLHGARNAEFEQA